MADPLNEAAVAETRRLAGWLGANVGWLGALLLTVTVVGKVTAVARLDYATAVGVVAASDKATIVLGTLTQLLPALAIGTALVLALAAAEGFARIEAARLTSDRTGAVRWFIRLVVTSMLSGTIAYVLWTLVPWTSAATAAFIAPLAFFAALKARRRDLRPTEAEACASSTLDRFIDDHPQIFVGAFVLALAAGSFFTVRIPLATLLSDQMWLPAEVVSPSGEPSWTGYLVSVEGDTALYLRDSDRRLVRLSSAVVRTSTYCTPARVLRTPSLSRGLSADESATPPCP